MDKCHVHSSCAWRISAPGQGHHGRGIAFSADCGARKRGFDRGEILSGQVYVQRSEIFLQVFAPLRAWNRNDIRTLREHPRQGQLRRRAVFCRGDRSDGVDEREIAREHESAKGIRHLSTWRAISDPKVLYLSANSAWTSYSTPVTLGIHDIEWRFQQFSSGVPQGLNAAWIDDVSFVGQ